MSRYANQFNTKETPQNEKIPGSSQIANSASGFSFEVNDWVKLDRFLILGTEGGSYYAGERELTIKASEAALRCLNSDGVRVVNRVVEISTAGRAPKNDPAIFVLALASKKGDFATRNAALNALPRVCRTGTHLFQFVESMQQFGGWGRATKRAVASWYTSKDADKLALQIVKYRQRNGWSHKDMLLLSHPGRVSSYALKFAVGKLTSEESALIISEAESAPRVLAGFLKAQNAKTPEDVVKIISGHPELPWEAIPSDFLKSPKVWDALLPNLPVTALIRNLSRMTANGLIAPMSDAAKVASAKLTDPAFIGRKPPIHPIALLMALMTYKSGHSMCGDSRWTPVSKVIDALDESFYLAFGNVEPSNKRTLLALDVSGSMDSGMVAGVPGLTPRIASAAMAMVTARVESNYEIVGFTSSGGLYGGLWDSGKSGLTHIDITPRMRLDGVRNTVAALPMGGTDCALPMIWAAEQRIPVDVFVTMTDNETWHGTIHPNQALNSYRQSMGIPAKMVIVGMLANDFTVADPSDRGSLDVCGFDTAVPQIISDFAKNGI